MTLAKKPRISQFTKTLLDLGWYMSVAISVLYIGLLVVSAAMQNDIGVELDLCAIGVTNRV